MSEVREAVEYGFGKVVQYQLGRFWQKEPKLYLEPVLQVSQRSVSSTLRSVARLKP